MDVSVAKAILAKSLEGIEIIDFPGTIKNGMLGGFDLDVKENLNALSDFLGLPYKYLAKCPKHLKESNLNHWIQEDPSVGESRLIAVGAKVRKIVPRAFKLNSPVAVLNSVLLALSSKKVDYEVDWVGYEGFNAAFSLRFGSGKSIHGAKIYNGIACLIPILGDTESYAAHYIYSEDFLGGMVDSFYDVNWEEHYNSEGVDLSSAVASFLDSIFHICEERLELLLSTEQLGVGDPILGIISLARHVKFRDKVVAKFMGLVKQLIHDKEHVPENIYELLGVIVRDVSLAAKVGSKRFRYQKKAGDILEHIKMCDKCYSILE